MIRRAIQRPLLIAGTELDWPHDKRKLIIVLMSKTGSWDTSATSFANGHMLVHSNRIAPA
jgi:hypothetical protein